MTGPLSAYLKHLSPKERAMRGAFRGIVTRREAAMLGSLPVSPPSARRRHSPNGPRGICGKRTTALNPRGARRRHTAMAVASTARKRFKLDTRLEV